MKKKNLSSESHYIAIMLHSQHELHNDMFEKTLVFCKTALNHSPSKSDAAPKIFVSMLFRGQI